MLQKKELLDGRQRKYVKLCFIFVYGWPSVKQGYVITFTGIFHWIASNVEARTLLRPHMIINWPIGRPDPSSNNDSPRANAVFLTGPIPSPPPINNTAGKWGSISSSILKSSWSREKWKNKQNQSSEDAKLKKIFTSVSMVSYIHLTEDCTAKGWPDGQTENTDLRLV